MDPWLEDPEVFPDLHERLSVYISEALNTSMPSGYVATLQTRVYVDDGCWREPDVGVATAATRRHDGSVALAELEGLTLVGALPDDPIEEAFIEIVSASGGRLVTAVEVLSWTNKRPGKACRGSYRKMQRQYLRSRVNLVELDLLRSGPHTGIVPRANLQRLLYPFD